MGQRRRWGRGRLAFSLLLLQEVDNEGLVVANELVV